VELRQLWRTLDFYCALLFALAGTGYRWMVPEVEAEAVDALSMLVVLALSTLAQNLFTLDGAARKRWRMTPVRGAWLLWRKGRVLLGLATVLCLPLNPLAGFTAMLAALAIGHHNSVLRPQESQAWRFSAGVVFPHGVLEGGAGVAWGVGVGRGGWGFLGGAGIALTDLFGVLGVGGGAGRGGLRFFFFWAERGSFMLFFFFHS
ncbi:hypothetical protein WDZ92_54000, partial [Nostoc sp. NIES-2111]